MATMTAPPPVPSKQAGEVTAQLKQAAGKIRFHDLTVGGLLLAVGVLGYVSAMILVDKYFDLDAWARQIGWCGFVGMLGFIGYRYLWRPLRASVNPLYTAKRIEETVPDAKNGVINWVDLQDANMPESVRAAVTAKAAKQIANADVSKALESRLLVWSGSAVAALVVLLAILFLVFKPSVFASLVGRALNPFSSSVIATRTSLTITQPVGGDLTLTAGQPVVIAVTINGRVPDSAAPDRIRLLLKHSQGEVNAEEVPLEPVGGSEWSVKVPEYLVQNGFWYRVAGGDAETAEHRVTVRPRPVFKAFHVQYEYPAYLNMKPETSTDPHLEAYRGTTVTVTATANRELKDGRMTVAGISTPVVGEVSGSAKDMLKVKFVMMENSSYRLFFTAINGETNVDSPPYQMNVISDQPPTVTFKPSQIDGQTLPLNGFLTLDADATDDFGLDKLSLRIKTESGLMLAAKPYLQGASLQRETDKTWPLTVEYKDSLKLTGMKTEAGTAEDLKEGMVLEYWLEATDNCTVPQANVGKSKVFKVRLGPPIVDPDQKKDQQKAEDARRNDEAAAQKQQDDKNKNEARLQKPGPQEQKKEPNPGDQQQPKPGDQQQPKPGDQQQPKPGDQQQPKPGDQQQTKPGDQQQPKPGDQQQPKPGDQQQPKPGDQQQPKPGDQQQPKPGDQQQPKPGDQQPNDAKSKDEQDLKNKAEQIQKEIDKQNKDAGQPKSGEPQSPAGASEPKPSQKKEDDKKNEDKNTESKPTPGATSTGDKSKNQPSEPKDDGKPKSAGQSEPKTDGGTPGQSGADAKPMDKSDPSKGQDSGKEKAMPPGQNDGAPMDPNPGKEAGTSKGAPEQDPKTGNSGAKPEAKPGEKKEGDAKPAEEKPMPGDAGKETPPDAGQGKPQDTPKPGRSKTEPDPMKAGAPPSEPKPGDQKPGDPKPGDTAAKPKDAGAKDPNAQPKAGEKPTPDDKARKEIEDAAKDLAGNDEAKKQAARDKLDKAVGKDAREGAEKMMNDLKSDDKATRDAAQKKLDAMKEQMKDKMAEHNDKQPDPKNGGGENTAKKPDPKELENAAKDLAGNDEAKKKAARDKLDNMVGKDAREKAEKMADDLKSNDPAKREAAEKQLKEMMDKMKNEAGKNDTAKAPTPEEMKKAEDLAKDLNSKDDAKRQNAEKELEKMMGKENRDKLKDELAKEAQKPGEPLSEAMKKKLEDLAKEGKLAKDPMTGGPPGGSDTPGGKPLTADEDFAKRAGSMQLVDKLKKARSNPELLKKLGWTQEDYDRFLKGYEEMVKRDEVAKADPANPDAAKPVPVPRVNTGTAGKVETRANGSTTSPQAGGTVYAPPGYTDAQREFFKKANQAKDAEKK